MGGGADFLDLGRDVDGTLVGDVRLHLLRVKQFACCLQKFSLVLNLAGSLSNALDLFVLGRQAFFLYFDDFGFLGGWLRLVFLVFFDLVFRRGWDCSSWGDDTVFNEITVPSSLDLLPASLGDDGLADNGGKR